MYDSVAGHKRSSAADLPTAKKKKTEGKHRRTSISLAYAIVLASFAISIHTLCALVCCFLSADVRLELAGEVAKSIQKTLPAPVPDLNAVVTPAVFPSDAQLQPSSILQLPQQATLTALSPKPDFKSTLGKLKPPRILLRRHHCELLQLLRVSLENRVFARDIAVYGHFTAHFRAEILFLRSTPALAFSRCFRFWFCLLLRFALIAVV